MNRVIESIILNRGGVTRKADVLFDQRPHQPFVTGTIVNSTRRFAARPCSVSFEAIG
jgi:hypothetical protein